MEKEKIKKTNELFYQVTENLDNEQIENLVEKLQTYLKVHDYGVQD